MCQEGFFGWLAGWLADYLVDLVLVPAVRVGGVVLERLGAGEVVVGRGGGDDVALPGYLTGEAGDGAGDFGAGECGLCKQGN